MKHLKMIGLAVVAVAALTAFVGVGTAAAVEGPTALCKVAESVCAATNQYGSTDIIKGATKVTPTFSETVGAKLETNLGTVICDSSVEGHITGSEKTVTTHLPGTITGLTFTNCTLSGNSCSIGGGTGNANNLPYTSSITTEGTPGNGSLAASSGGSGEPGATIVCGAIINCTFSVASVKLPVVGGALDVANAEALNIVLNRAGSKCPTTAKWNAKYFLSSPGPAFVEM